MVSDLFGKRLNSGAGKVDYDWDENAIVFQPSGSLSTAADRVGGNQEINHQFKIGSSIVFKPHLHWWQQVTTGAVDSIVFSAQWRLQRNDAAKATSWTAVSASAGTADDIVNE